MTFKNIEKCRVFFRLIHHNSTEKDKWIQKYLWSHKVCSVARCHEQTIFSPQLFGKAKITDSDGLWVARFVHIQDVTGLQVSMHNAI